MLILILIRCVTAGIVTAAVIGFMWLFRTHDGHHVFPFNEHPDWRNLLRWLISLSAGFTASAAIGARLAPLWGLEMAVDWISVCANALGGTIVLMLVYWVRDLPRRYPSGTSRDPDVDDF